jgi:dTDP-glucose 4,6-dehydratase
VKILVTGGAGFIGSALCRHIVRETDAEVVNFDKLTYAASPEAVEELLGSPRYAFRQGDIVDRTALDAVFREHAPDAVMHLAAETHVDRSIDGPMAFVTTNVLGTATLLDASRAWRDTLPAPRRDAFRFLHVSTDEVFGSLGPDGLFHEDSPYAPNSPYSASKAGSDHLVRAWLQTFGLPVVLTNCSNNYGPYQHPEKLIPLMIANGCEGRPLPVYGTGANVRDWLYVDDHVRALWLVLTRGPVGGRYNIGGGNAVANIDLVRMLCAMLDELRPRGGGRSYGELISFVADRPGHDARYAMDIARIGRDLGWRPEETIETGLRRTIAWYLDHPEWLARVRQNYDGERLGLAVAGGRE